MYLALLNKEQKEIFLGLAYNLSNIDGDYSSPEQQMIESYCGEMNIEYSDSIAKVELNTIMENINKIFDNKSIKIVLFELIGLAMVDNNYDETEHAFLNSIQNLFSVDSEFMSKAENYIKNYLDLQLNINTLILN
ncbi:MAG: TerB family tellurite resistance protein [Treponema sp.]|nr:TerB family tellurite resistance protein [Treponema sp.]